MGSLIGVLSTVILVSTVCTLIFAVGAYVISRKGRNGVGSMDSQVIPGADVTDEFPKPASVDVSPSVLFKRAQAGAGTASDPAPATDDEYQWK